MKILEWDKTSSINGVPASIMLSRVGLSGQTILLGIADDGQVLCVQPVGSEDDITQVKADIQEILDASALPPPPQVDPVPGPPPPAPVTREEFDALMSAVSTLTSTVLLGG